MHRILCKNKKKELKMIKQAFAMYDEKAEYYLQPFYYLKVGEALRSLQNEISRPDSPLSQNPEDFHLYHLGEYDDELGKFTNLDVPKLIKRVKDMVDAEKLKKEAELLTQGDRDGRN
jgi:hypothetical protein